MYLQNNSELNWGSRAMFAEHAYPSKGENNARKVKNLLTVIFIFSICSGAIRKWAIDSDFLNNVILGVQIVLPLSFFLLRAGKQYYFNPLMNIYALLLLALALNPMNLTIFHGVFGFLLHFGFWFAMFFYVRYNKFFDFRKLISLFIVLSLIELAVGYIQYTLPPEHFLNRYANQETIQNIAKVGDSVRITGTFSYLGGFTSFLLFYSFLIWTLIRLSYRPFWVILLFLLGMVGCFMSGSRSSLYLYLIIGVMMVFSEFKARKIFQLVASLTIIIVVGGTSIYFLGNRLSGVENLVNKSYTNFESRRLSNQNSGEEQGRIIKTIGDVVFFNGDNPTLGVGLGSTYQGANAVWGVSSYVANFPDFLEEEPARIVVEGGYILFIFKIVLFVSLFSRLHIPKLIKVILVILIFLFVPLVFNVYNAVFLFLGLSMLDNTHKNFLRNKKELYSGDEKTNLLS